MTNRCSGATLFMSVFHVSLFQVIFYLLLVAKQGISTGNHNV